MSEVRIEEQDKNPVRGLVSNKKVEELVPIFNQVEELVPIL